jgi:hypothetical protein
MSVVVAAKDKARLIFHNFCSVMDSFFLRERNAHRKAWLWGAAEEMVGGGVVVVWTVVVVVVVVVAMEVIVGLTVDVVDCALQTRWFSCNHVFICLWTKTVSN